MTLTERLTDATGLAGPDGQWSHCVLQPEGSSCPVSPPWAGSGKQRGLADRRGAACVPAGLQFLGFSPVMSFIFQQALLNQKLRQTSKGYPGNAKETAKFVLRATLEWPTCHQRRRGKSGTFLEQRCPTCNSKFPVLCQKGLKETGVHLNHVFYIYPKYCFDT